MSADGGASSARQESPPLRVDLQRLESVARKNLGWWPAPQPVKMDAETVAALVEAVKAAQALAETDSLDDAALYAAQKALAVALEPFASAHSADAPLPDGEPT